MHSHEHPQINQKQRAHESEQLDNAPHQRPQALRERIQDTGGPHYENTSRGYCYRLAQWQKTIVSFIKTVLWLQGWVDSTSWTDTKRTENCHPPRHEIRNETKISRWPPRYKLLPQKSERPDSLASHVCWNTAICTSLRHQCNICRSSTCRALYNHRSTQKTLVTSRCRHFLMRWKWISSHSGSALQFFEVDKLSNSTSNVVISHLRGHFVRYGIPDTLVSDNGPQFSSNAFRKFSKDWAFTHETISPGNSQANSAVETAVKIMKRLMRKCKASGEDLLLGLLNLRNTPTEGLNTSPAQRLLGRRTKSMVLTTETLLKPSYPYSYDEAQNKEDRKLKQRGIGRELSQLHIGSNVRVQPLRPHARELEEATIRKKLTGRSYEVEKENGQIYWRNRRFLRQTVRSTHSFPRQQPTATAYDHPEAKSLTSDKEISRENEIEAANQQPNEGPVQTRSGRVIKKGY